MSEDEITEVPVYIDVEGDSEWDDGPDRILSIKNAGRWKSLYRIDFQYEREIVLYTFEEPSS